MQTYLSGRQAMSQPLVPQPLPIPLDAVPYAGSWVLGDDGRQYYSDGTTWKSIVQIAEDVLADVRRFTTSNIEVEVGTGGAPSPLRFPTLSAAFEYLSRYAPAPTIDPTSAYIPFQQGTILIRSGYVAEEQILLDGINMGWVRILSEDTEVTVPEAALTRSEAYYDTLSSCPFLTCRNRGVAPRIKTMFTAAPDGLNRPTTGLLLRNSDYRDDLNTDPSTPDLHGFGGFDRSVSVTSNSGFFGVKKRILNSRFQGLLAHQGSVCSMYLCRVTGASASAMRADSSSRIYLQDGGGSTGIPAWANVYTCDAAGLVTSSADLSIGPGGQIAIDSAIVGGTLTPNISKAGAIFDNRTAGATFLGIFGPSSFTVATLPLASVNDRRLVHVSNGNAGQPCLALSNGTSWLRIAPGTAVSTT